jgi:hypothetical protein
MVKNFYILFFINSFLGKLSNNQKKDEEINLVTIQIVDILPRFKNNYYNEGLLLKIIINIGLLLITPSYF